MCTQMPTKPRASRFTNGAYGAGVANLFVVVFFHQSMWCVFYFYFLKRKENDEWGIIDVFHVVV